MGYDHRNWYHNPHDTTIDPDTAGTLVEKWRFQVSGFPPGTPIIADGKVFVMATGGTYAVDLETGDEIWSRSDLTGTASMAYADGYVYAHASTSSGPQLYKLDPADGTTVWGPVLTYAYEGCDAMSSPVPVGERVFVGHCCGGVEVSPGGGNGDAHGGVEALSTEDGSSLWTYWTVDEGEDGAMVWSTVGVDIESGTVYATTGNNYILGGANSDAFHAIDIANGMRKWVHQVREGDIWAIAVATPGPDGDVAVNPIVMDDSVAAGDKVSAFWAVDKASGERLWGREQLTPSRNPANGGILNAGAFDGSRLYTISNDPAAQQAKLYAMVPETGEDAWPPKVFPKLVWGGVSSANGVLYAAIDDELVVLEAASGEELVRFGVGGSIAGGAPAVAAGRVVVGSGLQYPFGATAKNNNEIVAFGLP